MLNVAKMTCRLFCDQLGSGQPRVEPDAPEAIGGLSVASHADLAGRTMFVVRVTNGRQRFASSIVASDFEGVDAQLILPFLA